MFSAQDATLDLSEVAILLLNASKKAYENSAALNGSATRLLNASTISTAVNRSFHQIDDYEIPSWHSYMLAATFRNRTIQRLLEQAGNGDGQLRRSSSGTPQRERQFSASTAFMVSIRNGRGLTSRGPFKGFQHIAQQDLQSAFRVDAEATQPLFHRELTITAAHASY